jgi:hypothetical protein
MEKEFISYELALRMKTLGFNENCYRVGNPNGAICWRFMDVAGVEGVGIDDILQVEFDERWVQIPTFSQVFRWLRNNYGYWCYIKEATKGTCRFYIVKFDEKFFNSDIIYSYEEAELTCLEKLIEIVEFKLNVK